MEPQDPPAMPPSSDAAPAIASEWPPGPRADARIGPAGPSRLALGYALGVFAALSLWAVFAPVVVAALRRTEVHEFPFFVTLVVDLALALLCLGGFRLGLLGTPPGRGPSSRVGPWIAFAFGLVFPVSIVLLRPAFASIGFGFLPALGWAVGGSALAALSFRWMLLR